MFTVFKELNNREDYIKTPNFSEASTTARIFYKHSHQPIAIWKDMEIKYLYYEDVLYQKIGG